MKRWFIIVLVLLMSALASAQETILDQPVLDTTSTAVDMRGSVYAIVDDNNLVPAGTRKLTLTTITGLNMYYLKTSGVTTLDSDVPFSVVIDTVDVSHVVTVPDNVSCIVWNCSEAGEDLVVSVTGEPNQTVRTGDYLQVIWSDTKTPTAGHIVYRRYAAGAITGSTDIATDAAIKTYVDGQTWLTIDSSIAATTNPVENQAVKAEIDKRAIVRIGDEIVVGSGVPATDDAAITTAITALNSAGAGTLWLAGEVYVTTSHKITAPISIRGIDSEAALHVDNAAAGFVYSNVALANWRPVADGSGVTVTASSRGENVITSANLALDPGDWVIMWSADAIPDIYPHTGGTEQRPMEMHQVLDNVRGSNQYDLVDAIVDDMTTSPLIIKVPILALPDSDNWSGVYVGDFSIRQDSNTQDVTLFEFNLLNGLLVNNVTYEANDIAGPGQMQFYFCANVKVTNCNFEGTENWNESNYSDAYLNFQGTNGVIVDQCSFKKVRHAIDSSRPYDDGATHYYGGPIHILVSNCEFYVSGNSTGGISPPSIVSSHPEGWDFTVTGCTFHGATEAPVAAPSQAFILMRCRKTLIIGNRFLGNIKTVDNVQEGVRMHGAYSSVIGNEFLNMWRSVEIGFTTGVIISDATVTGNVFRGSTNDGGYQVRLIKGDNLVVAHNTFSDSQGGGVTITNTFDHDNIVISHNTFELTPNGLGGANPSTIYNQCTGANDVTALRIMENTFVDCDAVVYEDDGDAGTTDITFSGNTMFNSGLTELVNLVGDSAAVYTFRENDLSDNSLVTASVNCGACVDANIKFDGNTAVGYGAASIGATGTDATNINTNQNAYNWTR